ncbi:MAG: ATP-binding protein, partial [Myxococcaceae bacterium]
REKLRLRGEVTFELGPLSCDGGLSSEAATLFRERARAAGAELPPRGVEARAVPELVRHLDGLPLAIELAAARATVLSPGQMLERLSCRLELLSGGARDASARHRTLEAAIGWSWDLLAPFERAALAQAAVFEGAFDTDAAEAVLGPLEALQALVDKSLVRALPSSGGSGRRHFKLYESIREYALRAEATKGEVARAESRHATYFLRAGGEWSRRFEREGGAEVLARLAGAKEQLLAVVRRALAAVPAGPESAARALEGLGSLDPVLATLGGPLHGYLALLDGALAAAGGVSPSLRAKGHRMRAGPRRMLGRLSEAAADCEAAMALAREAGDPLTGMRALAVLAVIRQQQGRMEEARTHHRAALSMQREVSDWRSEGVVLGNLALLEQELGHFGEARALFERALGLYRGVGHRRYQALLEGFLGTLDLEDGRLDEARERFDRAVEGLRAVGDRRFEGLFTGAQGAVHAGAGRVAAARAAFDGGQTLLEAVADPLRCCALEVLRGQLDLALSRKALEAGDMAGAARHVEAARRRAARALAPDSLPAAADGGPPAHRSDEIRYALRLLERGLANQGEVAPARPAPLAAALVVAADGAWFSHPDGARADLCRYRALRRILARLAEQRLGAPGEGLTVQALLEVGWPGERVIPRAGANRVYVAVATLRKLGLKELLLSRGGRYLLDPRVPIERGPRASAGVS